MLLSGWNVRRISILVTAIFIGFDVCGPVQSQEVVLAGRQGADKVAARLDAGGIIGRFLERTPENYIFIPTAADLPAIPVLNPAKVASTSVGPRLYVKGSYDNGQQGLVVRNYQLDIPMVTSPADPTMVETIPQWNLDVRAALTTFSSEINRSLEPGAMSADLISPEADSPLNRTVEQAEENLIEVYQRALDQGDENSRDDAVRALAGVRQQLKAIYGTLDNYPPWSYDRIHANSKSVVAIAQPDQDFQALCSGVLIAADLVLTAGHCFANDHPEDLQVWFGFVEAADGTRSPPVGFDITELVAPSIELHEEFLVRAAEERFDADMLDYAIVRFARGDDESMFDGIEPQCLRDAHSPRDRGLYVIGYPKGNREMVHDNGRVYLPFRLRPTQFEKLKRDIEIDFAELESDIRIALMEQFTASYLPVGQGASKVHELHDVRFGSQPKLGIVADTFKGNSGSPVYDRSAHCVVGMLTAGAPDTGVRLGSSWQLHETALPFPSIMESLEQHAATAVILSDSILDIR